MGNMGQLSSKVKATLRKSTKIEEWTGSYWGYSMQKYTAPKGLPPSVLGEGERKEGTGRAHRKGGESGGTGEHSEPFIQHKAGEESWLCVAAEWPRAAAQTHLCGCERAFSEKPQTCSIHLVLRQCQLSR